MVSSTLIKKEMTQWRQAERHDNGYLKPLLLAQSFDVEQPHDDGDGCRVLHHLVHHRPSRASSTTRPQTIERDENRAVNHYQSGVACPLPKSLSFGIREPSFSWLKTTMVATLEPLIIMAIDRRGSEVLFNQMFDAASFPVTFVVDGVETGGAFTYNTGTSSSLL